MHGQRSPDTQGRNAPSSWVRKSIPTRHWSIRGAAHADAPLAESLSLLTQRRPLDQFDASAPRVGDVGDRGAGRGVLARRFVKLDALRFDLLDEGRVVLHVEAVVVEHTAFGRRLRRVGLGKPDLDAWDIDDWLVIAGARLAAEGLRVPSLRLRDLGLW
jgi:hypothetical protein